MKATLPILRAHHSLIRKLVQETQRRYGIKIYALAIMENHLHFLILPSTRTAFSNALRFLAGMIPLKIGRGPLWIKRYWSRVVTWGRDFQGAKKYIQDNPKKASIFSAIDIFEIRAGILIDTS